MRKWFQISGQRIMEILLENSGATWSELATHLGFSDDTPAAVHMNLYNHLWALCDAGLIRVDGVAKAETIEKIRSCLGTSSEDPNMRMRASDEWLRMSSALKADFSGGAVAPYALTISPLFGKPSNPVKQTDVFVVMPFAEGRRAIYDDHIVPPIKRLGLSVARADDYLTTHPIMSDVWAGLCGCGVVVADCTGRNPNVFYEIGVAHTIGKPVVLITENADDVPADLRHMRYIAFEYTPRGMTAFERQLQQTVHSALGIYDALGEISRLDR